MTALGGQHRHRHTARLFQEPAAVVAPGRLLVHEENIVLRSDRCELLSRRAPAELPVIGT